VLNRDHESKLHGSSAVLGEPEYPSAIISPRSTLDRSDETWQGSSYGWNSILKCQTELFSHARQSVQVWATTIGRWRYLSVTVALQLNHDQTYWTCLSNGFCGRCESGQLSDPDRFPGPL